MSAPRWEWRAFGERLAPVERRLAAPAPERTEVSDEVYLLSRDGDASVKLRDGRLDVKALLQVAGDGLEQWRPALKATLPLDARDVRFALAALGVAAEPPARARYTLDELVAEVVERNPELLALRVRKRRTRYTFAGCLAEATELATPAGGTRTVVVEAVDPEAVRAAVHELGADALPVVCMARGLKALADFGARRFAAIDVGTNSVKLHVGERAADGAWSPVLDRAVVTRLGEGLQHTGRLAPPAVERTAAAVCELAAEARRNGAEALTTAGTAGLRRAANPDALLAAVQARCGVAVEIIPAEEEARLAYAAAVQGLGPLAGALAVFDTGGGSSQFTFGNGRGPRERFSVELGAVGLTERFGLDGPVPAETLAEAQAAIAGALRRLEGRSPPDAIVGLGGAVTNLAAVQRGLVAYDPDVVHGATLARAEIERQVELYRSRTADERRRIAGLQPKRAEVILAGACIVRAVLALLGREALTVSDRGLRHGLMAERFPYQPLPGGTP